MLKHQFLTDQAQSAVAVEYAVSISANEGPWFDAKSSDGQALVLEL